MQAEAVLGEVAVARRDVAAQLELHQQRLERQRTNVAVLGERIEHQLPLACGPGRLDQLVDHLADAVKLRGVAVDEVLQHVDVIAPGQHQAIGGLAIAAGTADLLAVVLHRLGQVEVHHVTDVGLVDAHAEGDGGDDAGRMAFHEVALDALAGLGVEPGVVGGGNETRLAQVGGQTLGGLLQGDVDDGGLGRFAAQPGPEPLDQATRPGLGRYRRHFQVEVGPVEAGGGDVALGDAEALAHVGDYPRRGRGGQQQDLGNVELVAVVGQLEVIGAEIMAPLRDAVGFVHDQQRDRHAADEGAEALVLEPLHRDHEDADLAALDAFHHCRRFLAALARVDAGGGDPVARQEGQLILHQRQQRRDDQGQVGQVQGRQLIAQRLARAGGKDRRRRTAGGYRFDDRALAGAEVVIAEDLL